MEILPITRFTSRQLAEVQQEEIARWKSLFDWDFSSSAGLISSALDHGLFGGKALIVSGKPVGYCFLICDSGRAIFGSFFLIPGAAERKHAVALLRASVSDVLVDPSILRVEVQLPAADQEILTEVLGEYGFRSFPRIFMSRELPGDPRWEIPPDHEIQTWGPSQLGPSSELLEMAYRDKVDRHIHVQYASVSGCQQFLSDLLRHPGCGIFDPRISLATIHRPTGRLSAFLIGSRVSPRMAHLPQVAVHPDFNGRGIGRSLMAEFMHRSESAGYQSISLNVTETNEHALRLYRGIGLRDSYRFNAFQIQR